MTDLQREVLAQAFGAHLMSAAALLTVWKSTLDDERAAHLAALEAADVRLGVAVSAPGNRCIVQVFVMDSANDTRVLEAIEADGSTVIN